ncbi:MAG TPA: GNAT family N-acetyltransferase [Pyrinomonadaceae bacterium]|nr:GNAT family N-acetyltransferase [Pyrinomonadaceae bacterium]
MDFILETERLALRAWGRDDAEALFELTRDADTMRYVGNGKPWADLGRAHEWLGWMGDSQRERGYSRWAVVEKDGGRVVGLCGFFGVLGKVDFGYLLARDCWGRGYATELGRAALRHGFERLNFEEVVARTAPENHASRRVLEKLGFEFRGLVYHEFDRQDVASYRLSRTDFNAG